MVLVFAGILPAAWVSSGNARISYAGVQIGLAFLLTILHGFSRSLSMDSGRDRVIGILLGNLVVYLIFTGIWPKSVVVDVRERLSRALAALARLARLEPSARVMAIGEAAVVETEMATAREQLRVLPLEPAASRLSPRGIVRLEALVAETRAMPPALMVSQERTQDMAERLARLAGRMTGRPAGAPAPPANADGEGADGGGADGEGADGEGADAADSGLAARLRRLERLAAGRS
ncbi:hypothetical protein [Roseateles sp.]|uniref:hypothetical protein n=1 Tax=Roseateles sp. TaxID=1971397 RepID=UPI0039E8B18C